jgi:hypothetical protein
MYVMGIRPVSAAAGAQPKIAYCSFNYNADQSAVLTSKCKNPKAVASVMDFLGYRPDSIKTLMYGIEGETYTVEADGRVNYFVDKDGSATPMDEVFNKLPKWTATPGRISRASSTLTTTSFITGRPRRLRAALYSPTDTSLDTVKAILSATRRGEWIPKWMSYDPINNLPQITYNSEESTKRGEILPSIENLRA